MSWVFTTNELCRLCFGVEKGEYRGEHIGHLVPKVVGEDSWHRYGFAQDPVPGNNPGVGVISIYVGERGDQHNQDNYVVIGKVERLP